MLRKYMLELGYIDSDIDKIRNMYSFSIYKEDALYRKIREINAFLEELGYGSEQRKILIKKFPILCSYNVETLKQKIDNMISLGYDKKDVLKMIKKFPQVFCYKLEVIKEKIDYFLSFGYSMEDVILMTREHAVIYGYSIFSLQQKIDCLMSLGYTKKDVIRMTRKLPSIYSFSCENIRNKIYDLEILGYTRGQVIEMTRVFSSIYSFSIENIKNKINDMIDLGYSYEEILEMTVKFPQLYGLSIDNIKVKKQFYDMIGITQVIVKDPKRLMQSVDLSYARYMFYKQINIEITSNNYMLLFISQHNFIKRYGKDNRLVMQLYSYDIYLKNDDILGKRLSYS